MKVYTDMEKIISLVVELDFYKRFWGCAPAIILRIFFCKVKIFLLNTGL